MVEHVWLHIGLPKTGSTSIQATLSSYDDGCCFYAQLGKANHSLPLYTAFSDQPATDPLWVKLGAPPEAIEQERCRVLAALAEQLGRHDRRRMILSGEGLSRMSHAEAACLLDFLQAQGARVTVVAYGRDPLAFAVSACQQLIKQGAVQIPNPLHQQIEKSLDPYRSFLGAERMIVRPFDHDRLVGGCVVKDFCQILSLSSSEMEVKRRNEALTAPAIKVLFHLNRTSPLQFGDAVLVRTRSRLIRVLRQIFVDGDSLDPALLRSRADDADADYLSKAFGVCCSKAQADEPPQQTDDLHAWLATIGSEVSDPIGAWLRREVDFSLPGASPSQLIHRLFYDCLCRDSLELNASLLRTVARRYEDGSPVRLPEALQLQELACKGKPHKVSLRRRLEVLRNRMR